jgi:hypothetical protein
MLSLVGVWLGPGRGSGLGRAGPVFGWAGLGLGSGSVGVWCRFWSRLVLGYVLVGLG